MGVTVIFTLKIKKKKQNIFLNEFAEFDLDSRQDGRQTDIAMSSLIKISRSAFLKEYKTCPIDDIGEGKVKTP